jgi:hypothetical protein
MADSGYADLIPGGKKGAYSDLVPDAKSVPDGMVPRGPKPDEPVKTGLAAAGDALQGAFDVGATVLTAPVAALAGAGTAVANAFRPSNYGTQEGAARAQEAGGKVKEALTYQPGEKGQEYLSDIGAAARKIGLDKFAGLGPVFAPEMAALGPAATKAAGAKVGEAALAAGDKVKTALTPTIEPNTLKMAQRATELGIPLRPDMLTSNKYARMVGEAMEHVPLSGSKAEQRQEAFNRAIGATIGADANAAKLTPDVFDAALNRSGGKIGEISNRTPVPLTTEFNKALDSHLVNAASFETDDVAKVVNSYVRELRSKAENGVVSGEAFRKLNSKIGAQARSTTNGDLRNALGELQSDMHDALASQLSGEDLAALTEARRQYATGMRIAPLVAKSPNGNISPAGLMQAVTGDAAGKRAMARGRGGDIGEIAKIGQLFLKEPASSGTAERTVALGLLGGGATVEPVTAAGILTGANLYNRTGAALTRQLTKKPAQNGQSVTQGTINAAGMGNP